MAETLMKLGGIAAFGIVAYLLHLIARQGNRRARAAGQARAAEIRSGRIIAKGWSRAAAREKLADFAKRYDLDAATFAVSNAGDALQVRWKRPITTDIALYLVNYLHDPEDSGTPKAMVAGVIPVPGEIAPQGIAAGTLAKIFVPGDDTEHDLVHALTPDGRAFRISFTRMTWEPVGAAGASDWVQHLPFTTES